jgi:hypothetical protein
MYKELQKLRNQNRESHAVVVPSSPNTDVENYMALKTPMIQCVEVALLDSASTHTILRSLQFFSFPAGNTGWRNSHVTTIAGPKNLTFREGVAIVLLPGNNPITCRDAMYAPDAPRSLISYRDLQANGIHVSTTVENDEEVLELRQGQRTLATATAGADGLYEIAIKAISPSPRLEEEVGTVARERCPDADAPNLARKPNLYLTAAALSDIWHKRLGHPGTTIFRRMLLS